MKIDMYYPIGGPFGPTTHKLLGVGGTENFIIHAAQALAKTGHEVAVYNNRKDTEQGPDGDLWQPLGLFSPSETRDVLWGFRAREIFDTPQPFTRLKALYLADTESHGLGDLIRSGAIDLAMFVGQWQADKISAEEALVPANVVVTSNGVVMEEFDNARKLNARVSGKCVHMATPERGTEPLLDLWPKIQARAPHASLHLYSSFLGWMMSEDDDEKMSCDVYARIEKMQSDGMKIVNHKHGNATEVQNALASAELYLYPTRWFDETNCMCVLEALAAGTPAVVTGRAALLERVDSGRTGYAIDYGSFHDKDFVACTCRLLEDVRTWRWMSNAAVTATQAFDYNVLVGQWIQRWSDEIALRGRL